MVTSILESEAFNLFLWKITKYFWVCAENVSRLELLQRCLTLISKLLHCLTFEVPETAWDLNFNPKQPKVFRVKINFREIWGIFAIKLRNFKLTEMPKLLNFRFPEGCYFFNFNSRPTELKRSSKIFFFLFPNGIAERKWAKRLKIKKKSYGIRRIWKLLMA